MTATSVDEHHPPSNGHHPPQVEESMPVPPQTLPPSAVTPPRGQGEPLSEPSLPVVRQRSVHRLLSESDAYSGLAKRKQRRRRGKGRWKPYHNMTAEERLAKDQRVEQNALKKRARLFSHGKPMAPYNTTQFLLEDREKRGKGDSDGENVTENAMRGCVSPQRERERLLSGSDPGGNTSESGSMSGEDDVWLGQDFLTEYDTMNMLRINGMSREEITREVITLERDNGKLVDRLMSLKSENDSLKQLLEQHNIDYEEAVQAHRRRSGDSFESDVSSSAMALPSDGSLLEEPEEPMEPEMLAESLSLKTSLESFLPPAAQEPSASKCSSVGAATSGNDAEKDREKLWSNTAAA